MALGIGANAAIFSVVRGVLLRPLVNRDEQTLIYIRHSARGIGTENATFSVPEIQDLKARIKSISSFGDFSTIGFTMLGLGEPRTVRAGVVGGSYFEVMGLRPVLGRLLDARDDGPGAAGAAVLTYRFWTTEMKSDPSVIGKTIRLGARTATIVGVLEPSVPYPAETEIIANVVTSPHHLSATMVTGRVHRMTELFGRLAPGKDLDAARSELRAVHASIMQEHPESYAAKSDFRIDAKLLRDQITSRARTVLLVLMAASVLIFIIACANSANLILARAVRRESELATRAALGASTRDLRRALLAESLFLCGTGAALGVLSAQPMVAVLAKYAARFSVRALEVTVDYSLLIVGVALAILAAVLLAYVPRLNSNTSGLSNGSPRVAGGGVNRRLRAFAVVQIAASFMLVAGATMLVNTLLAMQSAETGFETSRILAIDVPVMPQGRTPEQLSNYYREIVRRIRELPGVDAVAMGNTVPWRDAGNSPGFQFAADGRAHAAGEEDPRGRIRMVSPGYFPALGVPLLSGRDFTDADALGGEPVAIVSDSLARQMFPGQDALNHTLAWTDPVMKFINFNMSPRRIVGVVADIDDENIVPGRAIAIYHPIAQEGGGSRIFIHTRAGDPYALVAPVTRLIRELFANQIIERPATLDAIRAEVLAPDRLNAMVFGAFAAVALGIAIVGVSGVLAFSVSRRIREFGIRLAIGSQPRTLLKGILAEGAWIAAAGVAAGAIFGLAFARLARAYLQTVVTPGITILAGSSIILLTAALVAALIPALRAARVDVMEALRSE
jgi:putative ABC transport system permease protein